MAVSALQTLPSAASPLAGRPDLARLQHRVRRLEHRRADAGVLPTGAATLDAALPGGGLARGAVHELIATPARDARGRALPGGPSEAAVAGLCAALLARAGGPVLWCRPGAQLYAPALAGLGLDLRDLVVVRGRDDVELLWAMEEALRSGAVRAVAGEVREPEPLALRRLQLAAEDGGGLALLLRPSSARKVGGPAATRWRIAPLPGAGDAVGGSGAPRWRAELTRVRGGRPGTWALSCDNGTLDALPLASPETDNQEPAAHDGDFTPSTDRLPLPAPLFDRPRRAAG